MINSIEIVRLIFCITFLFHEIVSIKEREIRLTYKKIYNHSALVGFLALGLALAFSFVIFLVFLTLTSCYYWTGSYYC